MKKCITLLLALVMALTLVVPAWAVDRTATLTNSSENDKKVLPVTVVVNNIAASYNVKVEWEDLTFTYTRTEWIAGDNTYDGSWNKESAAVTVTNNSNADIWYSANLADDTAVAGVTVDLIEVVDKRLVAAPAVEATSAASSFSVRVNGAPTDHNPAETTEIKQLTVQIFTTNPNNP